MPTAVTVPMERLQFIGLTERDREALRLVKPILEASIDAILDRFYSSLATHPEIISKFQGTEGIRHDRELQASHWLKMFDGTFDQQYIDGIHQIGIMRERIGLAPRWYIGSYAIALSDLLRLVSNHFGQDVDLASRVSSAITKASLLDMDYATSIYIDAGKTAIAKQLAALAESFELNIKNVVDRLGNAADAMRQAEASTETDVETSLRCDKINCKRVHAAHVAKESVERKPQANTSIQSLSDAGQRMGRVVKLINHIADQTHLLATDDSNEPSRSPRTEALHASEVSVKVADASELTIDGVQKSEAVLHLAQELAQQASQLRSNVGAFIQNIRSGEASM